MSGIVGYGNSVGVPTVGGETVFDETYQDNPLVNVFCLGVLPVERLVLGRASGVGNLAVLFGSTTGRDGIGGVSVLASAGFGDDEDDAAKRPSVQVGDPFEEKRLIEACLELLDADLVVGIQDLGGAGLTCATSETASRGGVGMDVYVAEVPQREAGMEPFEVMTSESQERMLAIVEPGDLDDVLDICTRWEVGASVVGTVTAGGQLRILDRVDGDVLADVPASSLHEDAPLLRPAPGRAGRPGRPTGRQRRRGAGGARRPHGRPARPALRHVVGVQPVRPPAVPQHGRGARAATPACCGSSTRPPASTPGGRSPSPPTATTGGARSTRSRARRWWWPRRCSTWPASAPARWRWSTASTSATPSTPR